jgi:hypothetical protein
MNHLNQAAQNMVAFWEDPKNIPFNEADCGMIHKPISGTTYIPIGGTIYIDHSVALISDDGCMSAQGQTLYHEGGYTVKQLKKMQHEKADIETAKILGISVAHSRFLRMLNYSESDSPQEVLTNPEKYLGPNYQEVLRFWDYLDTVSRLHWKYVRKLYKIFTSNHSLIYKLSGIAECAAEETIGKAFATAANRSPLPVGRASYVGPAAAASHATMELIGKSSLLMKGESIKVAALFGFDPFDKNSLSENA